MRKKWVCDVSMIDICMGNWDGGVGMIFQQHENGFVAYRG